MNEGETVGQVVHVFTRAIQLAPKRGLGNVEIELEAMDLLMDYALLLGPEGLADVISVLALEHKGAPITRAQAKLTTSCCFDAERMCRAAEKDAN